LVISQPSINAKTSYGGIDGFFSFRESKIENFQRQLRRWSLHR
jgi:hypothetical protein